MEHVHELADIHYLHTWLIGGDLVALTISDCGWAGEMPWKHTVY